MEKYLEILSNLITADNVALLSVVITVLIFIFTRRLEIRHKKHDDKKIQYLKLIDLMEKNFSGIRKNKKGDVVLTDDLKKLFFDTGASLLMYGSRKVYRLYILFREFTSNPLIKQCKYYEESIALHIMSEILVTMRKEVGLSYFSSVTNNEALAFFVNDISCNPKAKKDAIRAKFCIRMIKFELWMIDRTQFVWTNKIYLSLIKPILAVVKIAFKYIIMIPFGKIIAKIFPKFAEKIKTEKNKS